MEKKVLLTPTLYHIHTQKNQFQLDHRSEYERQIINFLEVNTRDYIYDLSINKDFLYRAHKELTLKKNVEKSDFITLKKVYT